MVQAHRVLWGEGMFLRPQHFQQQALHIEQEIAAHLRTARTHPWGVRQLVIDEDGLRHGLLRLDRLSLIFQDGVAINAPMSEPLPQARNLSELTQIGASTCVYACLPLLNAFGGNTVEPGTSSPRPPRYNNERAAVSDLFTQAQEAEITALRVNVRLMVEEENRDGHLSIPLAKISKNATGAWQADANFIPPTTMISGAPPLLAIVRRLLDILLVKSQSLSAVHRERNGKLMEYGTSDISSFWLLHTVNRNFPLLNHFARFAEQHPEDLYLVLAQMAGELVTFSFSHTLNDIPLYQHEAPTAVFSALDTVIRELLGTVISTRFIMIPLTSPKSSFFIGQLESDRLIEDVDYYLSIQSELPIAQITETVPYKLKIGAPDDVEKILNSALPGIKLVHAAQAPSALPVRVGSHYFAFDPHGQIFERMLKSRSICIYVPQSMSELKLELIAVFR